MTEENYSVTTHEDDTWIYGETYVDGRFSTKWMKPKEKSWTQDPWETIIKGRLGLRINAEMIKQTSIHEGDTEFIEDLYIMCHPDWIELSDKQINMMARIIMSHYNRTHVICLKYAAITGILAGKSNKEIEQTIKNVISEVEARFGVSGSTTGCGPVGSGS